MKPLSGYSAIGGIFEYLNSDCDYEKWSQYLLEKLDYNDVPYGASGADLGCGNGYFTRAFAKAGYDVIGMDISRPALSAAVELTCREGLAALYVRGDISRFTLLMPVNFITAINDCINYVPPKKLSSAFKSVYKNLTRGGTFIFDISAPQKLKTQLGNSTIVKDYPEATLIWCNTLKDDCVELDLTLFTLNKDGTYTRSDETQTQYIYEEGQILRALKAAGFSVQTEGHLGGDKSERINFICKKQ